MESAFADKNNEGQESGLSCMAKKLPQVDYQFVEKSMNRHRENKGQQINTHCGPHAF